MEIHVLTPLTHCCWPKGWFPITHIEIYSDTPFDKVRKRALGKMSGEKFTPVLKLLPSIYNLISGQEGVSLLLIAVRH